MYKFKNNISIINNYNYSIWLKFLCVLSLEFITVKLLYYRVTDNISFLYG